MATNPTVEKLKVFGLRHGEKIAMGVVAGVFVLCAYVAATHESIQITPGEVDKSAKGAQANIRREQKYDSVVEKLEGTGVKVANFEKVVDIRQNTAFDATKYNLLASLASPEPGAGLIREMPKFLAPEELYVYANRGAVKVFKLDEDGELMLKPEPKGAPVRKRRASRLGGSRGLGGAMAGGGSRRKSGGSLKQREAEEKKRLDAEAARLKAGIARGNEMPEEEKEKDGPEPLPSDNAEDYIQENTGYRIVTLVGKFDHKRQKELYAKALKVDIASANPEYLRLDVERQELQPDGKWSDWSPLDRKNYEDFIKYRRTAEAEELVPAEARIDKLIDPLPNFEVGYWVGAHHGDLVPKELLAPKEDATAKGKSRLPGASGGGPPGAPPGSGMLGGMGTVRGPAGGGGGGAGGGLASAAGGGALADGAGPGRPMGGQRSPGGGDGNYQKTGADWVMIRALDMNVKADTSYRYRVRIYFANPNLNVEDALLVPGTDNRAKEQHGPWSETTAPVNFPGDVATYALQKAIPVPGFEARDGVQFQVVKWNPSDGYLFVKTYDQNPGDIIGGTAMMSVPDEKLNKPGANVMKPVDFVSHQVLADAMGGDRPMADLQGLSTLPFKAPAMAIVMRSDGTLVLRDQSRDAANEDRDLQKAIFDQFTRDMKGVSKRKGRNSSLSMGGGMSGPLGGGGAAGGPAGAAGSMGPR